MRIFRRLTDAEQYIAARREAARARGDEEAVRLWMYVHETCAFVSVTGQVYRFEDDVNALVPGEPPQASEALSAGKSSLARSSVELLLSVFNEALDPKDKEHILFLVAILNFIADTGQADEAEDYAVHTLEHHPLAIRHFATQAEAEEWLNTTEEPPSPTHILIGDQYWQFWYDRERNARGMYRDIANEPRIETFTVKGIPPGTPEFKTRAEAEEWLRGPPAVSDVFVHISGEYYFAHYYKRLKRHTLQHVQTALREWEEYKREFERRRAQEAANPLEEGDQETPNSD